MPRRRPSDRPSHAVADVHARSASATPLRLAHASWPSQMPAAELARPQGMTTSEQSGRMRASCRMELAAQLAERP